MNDDESEPKTDGDVGRWMLQFWGVISMVFLVIVGAFTFGMNIMQSRADESERKVTSVSEQLGQQLIRATQLEADLKGARDDQAFLSSYIRYITSKYMLIDAGEEGERVRLQNDLRGARDSLVSLLKIRRSPDDDPKKGIRFVPIPKKGSYPPGWSALEAYGNEWPVPKEIEAEIGGSRP